MALDTQPAGNVTVTIEDATGTDLTPDPASLTFTKRNWIAPQTVTVTAGQDHDVFDDEAILTHTVVRRAMASITDWASPTSPSPSPTTTVRR